MNARGQTCVDAKQYQSRLQHSALIKVINKEVIYFLTCLGYTEMVFCVQNDLIIKCRVRGLNITQLKDLTYNEPFTKWEN